MQTLSNTLLNELVLSFPLMLTTTRGTQEQHHPHEAHLVLCQLPSDGTGLLGPQVQRQVLLHMHTQTSTTAAHLSALSLS